jgi:hypothetical protein
MTFLSGYERVDAIPRHGTIIVRFLEGVRQRERSRSRIAEYGPAEFRASHIGERCGFIKAVGSALVPIEQGNGIDTSEPVA